MAQGGWGQGPIDIGRGFTIHLPSFLQSRARMVRLVVIAMAVLVLLLTGYYQVEPDEVGVVQRFGAYVRTTEPGPHLKIPFGVETVTKVPVQRQLKMEFGFRTVRRRHAHRVRAPTRRRRAAEAVMLTGDLNVAVVEWIVQYRIKDPRQYLFHVRDVPETFRYMSEAAMRQVVGDHSVDEVITIGREAIALQAKEELQRLCDLYGIGIEVQQLVLQDVNPPDPVKPAFNEVNQAIQEKERAINDAWADYNKAVPRAKGEAEQAVRAAEGYALERVNNAEGDANRFEALYEEYRKAPGGHAQAHLPGDAWRSSCPRLGRKVVLDEKARGRPAPPPARRRGAGGEAVKRPARSSPLAVVARPAALSSVYTVSETEQAILTQFGKPVGGLVNRPGLHLKVPFIQDVHRFDKRWLEFDGDANEIPTRDKKYIWVDTYARWRIADPLRFYQAVRDERGGAEPPGRHRGRRDPQRGGLLRPDRDRALEQPRVPDHRGAGRHRLRGGHGQGRRPGAARSPQIILEKAAKITPEFGIELVDVRFKRINYVETVQQKVFERMISERKRIAERSRSEGQGRAAEIRGPEGARHAGRLSVGYKTAQEVKGAADAKATAIYARAYGSDPELLPVPEDDGDAEREPGREDLAHPLHRLGAAQVPERQRRALTAHLSTGILRARRVTPGA